MAHNNISSIVLAFLTLSFLIAVLNARMPRFLTPAIGLLADAEIVNGCSINAFPPNTSTDWLRKEKRHHSENMTIMFSVVFIFLLPGIVTA
ncbi:hypothetical protein B0J13DRAFT_190833 [Dactylonectria estremocensis]|uniref:Uncharacterized protein n=1 Tax=Dactylonectria estremocensis TaxID=1079267 RepID=A0A9P9FD65_9HYPO|nr:hypothetical protein B0J13DRAFT_190833 [Dactylonectria estremocensis]